MSSILFVIEQVYDPFAGGVQQSTIKLMGLFSSNGYDVELLCHTPQDSFNLPYTAHIFNGTDSIENQFERFFENSKPFDIIINQSGYSLPYTTLIYKYKHPKSKLINTLRINPLNFKNNAGFIVRDKMERQKIGFLYNSLLLHLVVLYHIVKQRYIFESILKKVDAYVMLSSTFNTELFDLVPRARLYSDKIYGISNPFDLSKSEYKAEHKENVFLYVGRLELHQKRVDLLMTIWEKLHDLTDWEFWLVGVGDQEDFMKSYCEKKRMDRVKFFGKQNPDSFYRRAKLFTFTSAYEGFGNVLVETQMKGCVPVMFNSYPAAAEIVIHETTGLLVQPFNIDEYITCVMSLVEDHKKLSTFSKNGLTHVKTFSFEKVYQKWDRLFSNLLSN